MEEEFVGLTLRIPQDTHTKLKIISALQNLSMTQIITNMIDHTDITYPEFLKAKPKAAKNVSDEEKEKTKKFILELKERGMSLGEIVKKLNTENISTMTGKGVWRSGTLSKQLSKWATIPQNGE